MKELFLMRSRGVSKPLPLIDCSYLMPSERWKTPMKIITLWVYSREFTVAQVYFTLFGISSIKDNFVQKSSNRKARPVIFVLQGNGCFVTRSQMAAFHMLNCPFFKSSAAISLYELFNLLVCICHHIS